MRDIKYVTLNETCMETYQTPLKCNCRWNLNKNIKKRYFCGHLGKFAFFLDTFGLFITRIGWKLLKMTGMARYGLKWPKMAGKGSKLDGHVTCFGN